MIPSRSFIWVNILCTRSGRGRRDYVHALIPTGMGRMRRMHLLLYVGFFLVFLQQSHAAKTKIPECKQKYLCYYLDARDGEMIKVKDNYEIDTDKYPAIFMIHAYNQKHYTVKLQAFNSEIKTMELQQDSKFMFSCVMKDNEVNFYYEEEKKEIRMEPALSHNLKCEAEFKPSRPLINNEKFYKLRTVDSSDSETTHKKFGVDEAFLFCDPAKFEMFKTENDKLDKTKTYTKIKLHLNEAFCNDKFGETGPYSKIEIREKKGDVVSVTIDPRQLECVLVGGKRSFIVKDPLNPNKPLMDFANEKLNIEARCVGEAKFFCDYDPKKPEGKKEMKRTKGDAKVDPAIPSKLECHTSHPYHVIKGRTYKNPPKIECIYTLGSFIWSINKTSLIERSANAYCAAEMPCPQIPRDYRKGGRLDQRNVPSCLPGGILRMDYKGRRQNVKFECESTTGELNVVFEEDHRRMSWESLKPKDPKHIIFCYYAPPESENARIERMRSEVIYYYGIIPGIIAAIVTSILCTWICLRRLKMLRELERREKARIEADRANDRNELKTIVRIGDENSDEEEPVDNKNTKIIAAANTTKSTATGKEESNNQRNEDEFFDHFLKKEQIVIPFPKGESEPIEKALTKNDKGRFRMDNGNTSNPGLRLDLKEPREFAFNESPAVKHRKESREIKRKRMDEQWSVAESKEGDSKKKKKKN